MRRPNLGSTPTTLAQPTQGTDTSDRPRLVWVDRLRVWLTILVIAHHCAVTYSVIPLWYWSEPATDPSGVALTAFVVINQLYFMGAFFLLSGLFVPGSFDRKGAGRFARDRLLRLGVPLLVFVVIIRTITVLPAAIALPRSPGTENLSVPALLIRGVDPGPTWFLEVLLVFSLGYAAVRALRGRGGSGTGDPSVTLPTADRRPPWWAFFAVTAVLALLTFGWQRLVPDGTYWPVVGLPTPAYLPQYLLMFVVGILAARHGWLTALPARWAFLGIAATLGGGLAGAALLLRGAAGQSLGMALLATTANALFAVGAITLLVLVFRRWFSAPAGRTTQFLSQQAFVVYVIHPAVLVWWTWASSGVQATGALRAVLLFALAAPTCWLLAWLLRRIPAVRRIA